MGIPMAWEWGSCSIMAHLMNCHVPLPWLCKFGHRWKGSHSSSPGKCVLSTWQLVPFSPRDANNVARNDSSIPPFGNECINSPLCWINIHNVFFCWFNFLHTLWTLWWTLWATIHAHCHNNKDADCVWEFLHLLLQKWMYGKGNPKMYGMISTPPLPLPFQQFLNGVVVGNYTKSTIHMRRCKETKCLTWSNK